MLKALQSPPGLAISTRPCNLHLPEILQSVVYPMLRHAPAFLALPTLPRVALPLSSRVHTMTDGALPAPLPSALLAPSALASLLQSSPRPLLLDASWHLPTSSRSAHAEFLARRLPSARRFDIDAPGLADAASPLPHMLEASPAAVRALLKGRSLREVDVVVYAQGDPPGDAFLGAARAWWHLRAMGIPRVRVLDGGLRAAVEAGIAVESGPVEEGEGERVEEEDGDSGGEIGLRKELVWDMACVVENSAAATASGTAGDAVVLLDARSEGRFAGTVPEPRPGLRGGHVAGSFCLPSPVCVDGETGRLRSRAELLAALRERRIPVSPTQRYATTCGSGVTASVLALALHELGFETVPVYDGSWAEFGQPEFGDNPLRTGL